MKLVFYHRDTKQIQSTYSNLKNVKVVEKDVMFDGGEFYSIDSPYLLLEDEEQAPDVLSEEQLSSIKSAESEFEKQSKIDELSNMCEEKIMYGFASKTTGYFYRFNEKDQANFTQRLLIISNVGKENYTKEIWWRTGESGDGVYILHTVDQFISVCDEADEHKTNNLMKYSQLKEMVKNSSGEECKNITWDSI